MKTKTKTKTKTKKFDQTYEVSKFRRQLSGHNLRSVVSFVYDSIYVRAKQNDLVLIGIFSEETGKSSFTIMQETETLHFDRLDVYSTTDNEDAISKLLYGFKEYLNIARASMEKCGATISKHDRLEILGEIGDIMITAVPSYRKRSNGIEYNLLFRDTDYRIPNIEAAMTWWLKCSEDTMLPNLQVLNPNPIFAVDDIGLHAKVVDITDINAKVLIKVKLDAFNKFIIDPESEIAYPTSGTRFISNSGFKIPRSLVGSIVRDAITPSSATHST